MKRAGKPTPTLQKKPAKLRDVANLAGVSTATVSRAINSPDRLDTSTLGRVRAAMSELKYVPSAAGRALRTAKSKTIGMCIPDLGYSMFSQTVESAQSSLNENEYMLLLSLTGHDFDLELREVRNMLGRGVEGIILVGTQHHPELFPMLVSHAVPFVVTWTTQTEHPCVGFDHRRAMNVVGNHLCGLGHTDIAAIMPNFVRNDRIRDRVAGLRDALVVNGLNLREDAVIDHGNDLAEAQEAAVSLLTGTRRPTAIVCANDMIAAGVLAACRAHGFRVPADISVTGYCNMQIGQAQVPKITTVAMDIDKMGRRAADYLIQRIQGGDPALSEDLSFEFIPGGSTGPAKTG